MYVGIMLRHVMLRWLCVYDDMMDVHVGIPPSLDVCACVDQYYKRAGIVRPAAEKLCMYVISQHSNIMCYTCAGKQVRCACMVLVMAWDNADHAMLYCM